MKTNWAWAFLIAGILAAAPAIADKPASAGGGKGKSEKSEPRAKPESNQSGKRDGDENSPRDSAGAAVKRGEYFGDRHRTTVHDYYSEEFRNGRCPPGLAKKDNGCMPPGQAKKWTIGRPLPRDVIFHDLPPALARQFDRPPAGYRYARVDSDILLIGLGTGIVIDAIRNLGRV